MDVAPLELLAAVLAVVALIGSVAYLISRFVPVPSVAEIGRSVERIALWLAFSIAATATAGSLYFSEIEDYVPCRLCWFQRIFMYPLSIVLLVAAIRRDRAVRYTAVPLAALGAAVSAYHVALERGWFDESSSCEPTVPCSVPWFEVFGFVTLAGMALCGFVAIIILTLVRFPADTESPSHSTSDASSDRSVLAADAHPL